MFRNIIAHLRHLTVRLGITWLLLVCIFTGAMIAVHTIPSSAVRDNTAISIKELYEIPQPIEIYGIKQFVKYDTFTDRIILDMVRSADHRQPVSAAMLNRFPASDLMPDIQDKNSYGNNLEDYARYWQGHQIPARIAMTVTTLKPLLIFNIIIGILLFAATTVFMARRTSKIYATAFAIFIIISGFPVVLGSLQFTDIYFITFIAMLLIMLLPSLTATHTRLSIAFFIIGGLTTFFDFLTFPLFTLCFPLVTLLLPMRSNMPATAVAATASWMLGYGGLWISKWAVGSLLTSENIFIKAIDGINERTGNVPHDANWILILVALIAILVALTFFIGKKKNYNGTSLLAVAAIPLLWFAVLKNHSTIHFSFTWRTLIITFYCITVYYIYNNAGKSKSRRSDTLLQ